MAEGSVERSAITGQRAISLAIRIWFGLAAAHFMNSKAASRFFDPLPTKRLPPPCTEPFVLPSRPLGSSVVPKFTPLFLVSGMSHGPLNRSATCLAWKRNPGSSWRLVGAGLVPTLYFHPSSLFHLRAATTLTLLICTPFSSVFSRSPPLARTSPELFQALLLRPIALTAFPWNLRSSVPRLV